MTLEDRQDIYAAADRARQGAPGLSRLVLLHTALSALVLLAVTAVNFLLQNQIEETGGLAGMGMRSALETAATVLQLAVSLALPFWNAGYTAIILKALKGESCNDRWLLLGFQNFGPVLKLTVLEDLVGFALALVAGYPAMLLFLDTPWAAPLNDLMPQMNITGQVDEAALTLAVEAVMVPVMLTVMVAAALVAVPVFYRLRYSWFALLDAPEAGARNAMGKSLALTKGNCMSLLKIDFHFWWYYLLDGALLVLAYSDTVLSLLGIPVPGNATVFFFGTYILYLAAQLVLYWRAKNRVHLVSGICYQVAQIQPPRVKPRKVPWNE